MRTNKINVLGLSFLCLFLLSCGGGSSDQVDRDGDGYPSLASGGTDCNDNDSSSYPGAEELCDGNDNNCDGLVPEDEVDHDSDGYVKCSPWNDVQGDNPKISGGSEVLDLLNGIDEDGDGYDGEIRSIMPNASSLESFNYAEMGIDSKDNAYIFLPSFRLYSREGNQWIKHDIPTEDFACDISLQPSMTIDSSDNIHVAYYCANGYFMTDKSDCGLHYLTNTSGSWKDIAIDVPKSQVYDDGTCTNQSGIFPSISVDNNNLPQISYLNSISPYRDRVLRHAKFDGSTWRSDTVYSNNHKPGNDAPLVVENPISLVIRDGLGVIAYQVYRAADNGDRVNYLYLAEEQSNGTWILNQIDIVQTGFRLAMTLDPVSNNLFIISSYYNESSRNLRLISNDGGFWKGENLDE